MRKITYTTCKYCGKHSINFMITRYHNENCKHNPNLTEEAKLKMLSKRKLSEEHRNNITRSMNKPEVKAKISNPKSIETKKKISNSIKELWTDTEYRDKTTKGIIRIHKNSVTKNRHRACSRDTLGGATLPVNIYDVKTGECLAEFVSLRSVFDNHGFVQQLYKVARGIYPSYAGLKVRYVSKRIYEPRLKELYDVDSEFLRLKPTHQKLVNYYLLLHRFGIKDINKFQRLDLHPRLVELNKETRVDPDNRGKRISEALKGKPISQERKDKISETLSGRKLPAEHVAKISEGLRKSWRNKWKRKY